MNGVKQASPKEKDIEAELSEEYIFEKISLLTWVVN